MDNPSDMLPAGSMPAIPTTDKREQILDGAIQVFLARGYADTSMDRVAATAGVSKQTIYSYFQDKEGLFAALIERVTVQRIRKEFNADAYIGEPAVALRRLATSYLRNMDDPEYLALIRTVIAESVRFPELAQLYTRTVICQGHAALVEYFNSRPELGIADPEAIARIFWGSLVAFLLAQEILYGKDSLPMAPDRLINSLVSLILNQPD